MDLGLKEEGVEDGEGPSGLPGRGICGRGHHSIISYEEKADSRTEVRTDVLCPAVSTWRVAAGGLRIEF